MHLAVPLLPSWWAPHSIRVAEAKAHHRTLGAQSMPVYLHMVYIRMSVLPSLIERISPGPNEDIPACRIHVIRARCEAYRGAHLGR
jgi:hypothetical protein